MQASLNLFVSAVKRETKKKRAREQRERERREGRNERRKGRRRKQARKRGRDGGTLRQVIPESLTFFLLNN